MQTSFKQYARGQRTQLIEENFKMGMQYSSAPLNEGYLKEIVNYDIKENGEVISPRPGIQATSLHQIPLNANTLLVGVKTDSDNNQTFYLGEPSSTLVTDTKLYKGKLGISVGQTVNYLNDTNFTIPINAEIHNLKLADNTPIAKHIGAFAYNSDYYSFNDTTICKNTTPLTARVLSPKEAVMWGYNMLSQNPYTFSCSNTGAGVNLTGLLPYDSSGNLLLSPSVNQTLKLKCFYVASKATYKVRWEMKDLVSANWTVMATQTVDTNTNLPFELETSFPTAQIMVRLSVFESSVTDFTSAIPLQIITVGFNLDKEDYGNTANVTPTKYSLQTATGMAYWKNRLVVYGVKEDATQLFMSEINDPTYFPYPNNVDIFDDKIMFVQPYLDNLLVFTTRQLFMLSLSEDGLTWNKKLIQSNLTINPWDLHLIKIVKNMVYFRSGNYYYMIVPKASSTTGELVIAPISKQIEPLLNNFEASVEKTLEKVYNYREGVELIHYYNFLDYEDIHNVYVFRTSKGVYLNYVLLYNSLTRYWRVYTFESTHFVVPHKQDATRKGILMSVHSLGVQLFQYNYNSPKDLYYNSNGVISEVSHFPNYQLIDTGLRNHASDFKKRYRELQIKINNVDQQQLKIYSEFNIDGSLRKSPISYTAVHRTDPSDPKYGYITLERNLIEPSVIPSGTILGESLTDIDCWLLDQSQFPEAILWKIRIPVSGKGYAPNLVLLSLNDSYYEILNMSWVYRQLNSR